MIQIRLQNVPDNDGLQTTGMMRDMWLPDVPRVGEAVELEGGQEFLVEQVLWNLSPVEVNHEYVAPGVLVDVYLEVRR